MRGVAVLMLALALEGPYLASGLRFPVQSPTQPTISITDADEIRVGDVLAGGFAVSRRIEPTAQSQSIEKYLQMVGERVAANAQRQLPYRFHYDPDPRCNENTAVSPLDPFGVLFSSFTLSRGSCESSTESEERIRERIVQMQSFANAQTSPPAETALDLH